MKIPTKTIEVINHVACSKEMKRRRETAGISVREVARRMKLSAPYISDLETGRRNWDEWKVERYLRAIKL